MKAPIQSNIVLTQIQSIHPNNFNVSCSDRAATCWASLPSECECHRCSLSNILASELLNWCVLFDLHLHVYDILLHHALLCFHVDVHVLRGSLNMLHASLVFLMSSCLVSGGSVACNTLVLRSCLVLRLRPKKINKTSFWMLKNLKLTRKDS